MPIKTPKQAVEAFGTRKDLVAKIAPLIGANDDEKRRLMGTTNAKLLRIHEVATRVSKDFGGKDKLIDAIAKLQFAGKAPNAGWREKMSGLTVKRLFDKHRELSGKA
ncbi:MAG: hypothetical protein IT385_22755 [Deltaproteobacteria bacterium]|nr:hypothetical protein [Deltaproteobacteria bacterium]